MQRLHWTLIFIFWVQFVIKKNAFTFGGWCYYAFTVTVSYVITRERWFHAENFLAFDQIQLDAYRTVVWRRFEATFKLRPVIPIFERNEMTECSIKPQTSLRFLWPSRVIQKEFIIELTISFEKNIDKEHQRKSCKNKKSQQEKFVRNGRTTDIFPIEVGCRDFVINQKTEIYQEAPRSAGSCICMDMVSSFMT